MSEDRNKKIDDSLAYLKDGGLGEVLGFASSALDAGQPKVQMDSEMAVALCMLADLAVKAAKATHH